MKNKGLVFLSVLLFALMFILNVGSIEAFDQITAQEAYDMVSSGGATIIDVRCTEESFFIGSPALASGGDPIAYLIPWNLFKNIDGNGEKVFEKNPDFDALVKQTFGADKDQPLIIMCGIGSRSSFAAQHMEQIGFTNLFEIDNNLKEQSSYPGGRGGFQGPNYGREYNGYDGYPGRLPAASGSFEIEVATDTDEINNEDDSVSWMDTGLPITHKIDPKKIPKLAKEKQSSTSTKNVSTFLPVSGFVYQPMPYIGGQYQLNSIYEYVPMLSNYRTGSYLAGNYQPWSYQNQTVLQDLFFNSPSQFFAYQSSTPYKSVELDCGCGGI